MLLTFQNSLSAPPSVISFFNFAKMKDQKPNSSKKKKYIILTWTLFLSPVIGLLLFYFLVTFEVFGALPDIHELQNPKSNLASIVFSGDGKVLGKYYRENRINVSYKDLGDNVIHALVATEDARFYEHSGVDLKALFRSVSGVLTGKTSAGGGSTLTQQLAKMQFPRDTLSKIELVVRKVKEWVIAMRLEKLYTKEEIMAMYLNKFDFLHLAVGIRSAAEIYFNTSPAKLMVNEAALLVGMAKNPAFFNPVSYPDRAIKRRNVVLSQMKKYQFLRESQFDSLKTLPLSLKFTREDHNEGLATYFREYLRDTFLKEWCKSHKKQNGKSYDLYRDGLRIYTTLDSRMQKYAEESVQEHMPILQGKFDKNLKQKKNAPFAWNVNTGEIEKIMTSAMHRSERYKILKRSGKSEFDIATIFHTSVPMRVFSWKGDIDTNLTPWDSIRYYKRFLQTGFMAMEPQTGYVKAWVGGINHTHFQYDHVQRGHTRQVGSTFKPFIYALAIQEGYSPCYQLPCVMTCITTETNKEWCPHNSGGEEKFENKPITLKKALALSINYISAALMKKFGPQAVTNLVKRMGVTAPLEPVPSLCLGVADISVFEMVGANSTFANRGTYVEPIFITRIEDNNGKVLEEFSPKTEEVFNEEKAYIICDLLKGVCNYGTGAGLRGSPYKLSTPIAGKTGTTQNNSDGWFIGLTPDLVAGCWVGGEDRSVHFDNMAEGQGATMALPIWGRFFRKVYDDKTIKISKGDFFRPAKIGDFELDCSKYDKETPNNTDESTLDPDYFN